MKMLKNKTKISILSFTLLSIILIGVLSTPLGASTTYQLNLAKGTDEFTVDLYNEANWKTTVDASLTPSDWFEGEANITNAKSKITLTGWTLNTWGMYDALISVFLSGNYSVPEIIDLLIIMSSQGFDGSYINSTYPNEYSLWIGPTALWNYTTEEYEESPSSPSSNHGIIILQNPLEYKTMLDDYNALATELNGNAVINSTYSFPYINADDFLFGLTLDILAIAGPQTDYLESIVNELGCENATVSGSTLILERYGLTNYTVEISYGERGMMSSFTVKDVDGNTIYQITSSNSEWLFYLILIIVVVCSVAIVTIVIIRKKKLKR